MWGSLDGSMPESWPEPDWKRREAEEGLALQQADARKKRTWGDTWNDVKAIPGNLAGMAGAMVGPAPMTSPSQGATPVPAGAAFGTLSPAEVAEQPETGFSRGVREAVSSGLTAPGDAMAGKLAVVDPETGHTSPEAVRRAFDTASLAGGGAMGGAASKAVLAADAAKSGAPVAAAAHAPPFFSALDQAVDAAKMTRAPGAQWEATLRNAGVKPEELDWRGATDLFQQKRGQPITKQELQAHLEANPVPEVQPVDRGFPAWEKLPPEQQWAVHDQWKPQNELYRDPKEFYEHRVVNNPEDFESIFPNAPKWSGYQLPGGENYRERVMTLPEDAQNYKSAHWSEPNVLVHRRSTDRYFGDEGYQLTNLKSGNKSPVFKTEEEMNAYQARLPDGLKKSSVFSVDRAPLDPIKSLHAEEIQSDWHQAGRKEGYGDNLKPGYRVVEGEDGAFQLIGPTRQGGPDAYLETGLKTPEEAMQLAKKWGAVDQGVPDAPFKKTWHELAAKDMLREAAEGDYPRVSWTAGESQPTNPKNLNTGGGTPNAERLAAYDKADAGLKGFYDKMLPDYLNKLGKKYGAKVERGTLPNTGGMNGTDAMRRMGIAPDQQVEFWKSLTPQARDEFMKEARKKGHDVFYMDVPEAMRSDIKSKGMALFEDTGPVAQSVATAAHVGGENVAGAKAGLDVGRGLAGGTGGEGGLEAAQAAAARHAGAVEPLAGLPRGPFPVGGLPYVPGPIASVHDVAKSYMEGTGRPYVRQDNYRPVNPEQSTAIAKAFDEMPHAPDDPRVRASYKAMINETGAQYDAAVKSGVKFEPIPPGMPDPYAETPRLAAKDVQENKHLWYFPTDQGFGSGAGGTAIDMSKHPMMQASGRKDINGNVMLNNDLFRVVHDYFGHLKEGHGFRAAGEDNAWRTHANMYSDEAKPAMTTETRGQNSWVNYGPHGDANRKASAGDTVFADQKVGLLPDWVWKDEMPPAAPAIAKGRERFVNEQGLAIPGREYTKEAQSINREIAAGPKGEGPLDLSLQKQTPDVEQVPLERHVPPRGIPARMQDAMANPDVAAGLDESMHKGAGVSDWYHTEPIRREFVKTLGKEQGETAFKQYMDLVAATSPRSDVPTNIRNASYYYSGGDPTKQNPYPYGHVAQNLHKQNVGTVSSEAGWNPLQNPKPASFAENLRGNLEPVTVDTHAFRNIAMRTKDPRFLETSFTQKIEKGREPGPDSLVMRFGEIKTDAKGQRIVTFRPQQLVKDGKITMEEAQKIPSFWASKPKDNEYAAAENLFRQAGNRVGMRPADAQAAAWSGAGEMTGLGTVGTHTFNELMNERIMFTAKMRGEKPEKVLQDFIRRGKPLLSEASHGMAFGSLDGRDDR